MKFHFWRILRLGIILLNITQVYYQSDTNITISDATLIIFIKELLHKIVEIFMF